MVTYMSGTLILGFACVVFVWCRLYYEVVVYATQGFGLVGDEY